MYKGIVYVYNSLEMTNMVLREMHNVPYVGHPGYEKKIASIKSQCFFPSMKKEVAKYIDIFIIIEGQG